MTRKGSRVKAARDITWEVVLGVAAPPTILDSVLVSSGTPGKVVDRGEHDLYLVEFEGGQEWWLKKEDIKSRGGA